MAPLSPRSPESASLICSAWTSPRIYVLKLIDEIELKIIVLGNKSSKFGGFFHTLKGPVGKKTYKRAFDWLIFRV